MDPSLACVLCIHRSGWLCGITSSSCCATQSATSYTMRSCCQLSAYLYMCFQICTDNGSSPATTYTSSLRKSLPTPRIALSACLCCVPSLPVRSLHIQPCHGNTLYPHTVHPNSSTVLTYMLYRISRNCLSLHPFLCISFTSAPYDLRPASMRLAHISVAEPSWSYHKPKYLNRSTCSTAASPYISV